MFQFQSKSPTFYELNPKLWAKSSHSNRVLRLKSHENPTLGASTPTFSHFAGRPRCPSVSLQRFSRCMCCWRLVKLASKSAASVSTWDSPMGHRWVSIHHGIPSGKHTKSAIENGHRNWVMSESPWKWIKMGIVHSYVSLPEGIWLEYWDIMYIVLEYDYGWYCQMIKSHWDPSTIGKGHPISIDKKCCTGGITSNPYFFQDPHRYPKLSQSYPNL